MTVTDTQASPINKIMESAFKEFGVKKRDTNGRNKFGYSHTQATIRNGVRWSTEKAFLRRSLMWDNLYAMTGASAQKIVFEGKKAVGVQFTHKGEQKSARGKEVILTAGTIGSTKLLLLSGVGPKAHLTAMKIPVVADLPVGENLQDHVTAGGIEFYTPFSVSVTPAKAENFLSAWRYSLFGKGMKMSPRFREGIAFLRTRQQPQHIKYPLIALEIVSNIGVYSHDQLNLKEHIWESLHGHPPQREGFTIFAKLLHPRSKGTIRLRSTNPEDSPLINPNYLAEDIDVKTLSEAYQVARKLANTKAMKDWEMEINDNLIAPCQKFGNYTREYIECFLKQVTLPGDNPVGTCKLGAAGDPTAVVDPLLRVRGLKNLRVIDASVIPNAISGNVYTTQVMMAEKMADTLLARDSVKPIVDYFRHMLEVKHTKVAEDEDQAGTVAQDKKSRR